MITGVAAATALTRSAPVTRAVLAARPPVAHIHAPPRLLVAVVLVVLGLSAAGMGWLGLRRGASLVPGNLPEKMREHRLTVLHRGVAACFVAGFVLVGLGVATGVVP